MTDWTIVYDSGPAYQRFMGLGEVASGIKENTKVFTTFVQRRPNVFGVYPTLYKSYTNVL